MSVMHEIRSRLKYHLQEPTISMLHNSIIVSVIWRSAVSAASLLADCVHLFGVSPELACQFTPGCVLVFMKSYTVMHVVLLQGYPCNTDPSPLFLYMKMFSLAPDALLNSLFQSIELLLGKQCSKNY